MRYTHSKLSEQIKGKFYYIFIIITIACSNDENIINKKINREEAIIKKTYFEAAKLFSYNQKIISTSIDTNFCSGYFKTLIITSDSVKKLYLGIMQTAKFEYSYSNIIRIEEYLKKLESYKEQILYDQERVGVSVNIFYSKINDLKILLHKKNKVSYEELLFRISLIQDEFKYFLFNRIDGDCGGPKLPKVNIFINTLPSKIEGFVYIAYDYFRTNHMYISVEDIKVTSVYYEGKKIKYNNAIHFFKNSSGFDYKPPKNGNYTINGIIKYANIYKRIRYQIPFSHKFNYSANN